jgi:hypothetical protein
MGDSGANARLVTGLVLLAFGVLVLLGFEFFFTAAQASAVLGLFFGAFLPIAVGGSLLLSWFARRRESRRRADRELHGSIVMPREFDGGTPLASPGSTFMYWVRRPPPPKG